MSVLSLPLLLFTLVVSMVPKRKSTLTRNPLHSEASLSSDSTLSHIQFRDDDAFEAFLENFSKRGNHTLLTPTFPLSFIVGDGSHYMTS